MNLSPHFKLHEFLLSETAARKDIDMTPSPVVISNLQRLCASVLEPIREAVMAPIVITSGYRPEALNKLVGGSKRSDHLTGCAADIVAVGVSLDRLAEVVKAVGQYCPIKQAIKEFDRWIHVSVQLLPEVHDKPEFLVANRRGGVTVYSSWA